MPISWLQCHIPDLAKAAGEASYDDVAVTALLALFGAGYLLQGIIWNRPDPYEYKLYERPQETFKGNAVQKVTRNIAQKLEESVRVIHLRIWKTFRFADFTPLHSRKT